MELDLPTPVSRPPSLEMHERTEQRTHPSNTQQKSAEKMVRSVENGYPDHCVNNPEHFRKKNLEFL
jgi:hypothetical protein